MVTEKVCSPNCCGGGHTCIECPSHIPAGGAFAPNAPPPWIRQWMALPLRCERHLGKIYRSHTSGGVRLPSQQNSQCLLLLSQLF